jgi:D-glycero-D-manno-heptose 1,7-bisphosphate phosphatase
LSDSEPAEPCGAADSTPDPVADTSQIQPRRAAVFLDRDGVLVRDRRHGAEPALMRLLPGVRVGMRILSRSGFALVVVTNQSGIARGIFDFDEAFSMGRRLAALLAPAGVRLDGYYLAPNHSHGRVPGLDHGGAPRKPDPALILRAAADLRLDLSRSWILGDRVEDLQAGCSAGLRPILIDIGSLAWQEAAEVPAPLRLGQAAIARNLCHAAAIITAVDGEWTALPVGTLLRPARPADRREAGEESSWPAVDWLRRARRTRAGSPRRSAPLIGAAPRADI